MNINDFQVMKKAGKKISMVTCYDYWTARIIAASNIDCVLVGDSLAMVMYGHSTTIPATVDIITQHINAVAKGVNNKFIIGDMPFLSYRKGIKTTLTSIEKLMRAGAQAIKLEGAEGNADLIHHIVESGVPVMGHIGMTPQSIHQLGGFKVQGYEQTVADKIIQQAIKLQEAGCFSLVLECVPENLAKIITHKLVIPTIGIGAGAQVDGQVLVLQDLLGMNPDFTPKFLKTYLNGFNDIKAALNQFNSEVKMNTFPAKEHCY